MRPPPVVALGGAAAASAAPAATLGAVAAPSAFPATLAGSTAITCVAGTAAPCADCGPERPEHQLRMTPSQALGVTDVCNNVTGLEPFLSQPLQTPPIRLDASLYNMSITQQALWPAAAMAGVPGMAQYQQMMQAQSAMQSMVCSHRVRFPWCACPSLGMGDVKPSHASGHCWIQNCKHHRSSAYICAP